MRALVRRADEVVEMSVLGLVQLQGPTEAVENSLRDSGPVAAFEPHVVLGAHAGQQGHLFAPQRLPPTASAEVGQARLGWGEPFAPRGQELTNVVPVVHGFELR